MKISRHLVSCQTKILFVVHDDKLLCRVIVQLATLTFCCSLDLFWFVQRRFHSFSTLNRVPVSIFQCFGDVWLTTSELCGHSILRNTSGIVNSSPQSIFVARCHDFHWPTCTFSMLYRSPSKVSANSPIDSRPWESFFRKMTDGVCFPVTTEFFLGF